MILTFKRYLPVTVPPFENKELTQFRINIMAGIKDHTFRLGDRWQPGHFIHFWEENPRTPQNTPAPFNIRPQLATHWGDQNGHAYPLCAATEIWKMSFDTEIPLEEQDQFLAIGNHETSHTADELLISKVAYRDGLSVKQFKYWFFHLIKNLTIEGMRLQGKWVNRKPLLEQPEWPCTISAWGQIIHWTDNVYFNDTAKIYQKEAQKVTA